MTVERFVQNSMGYLVPIYFNHHTRNQSDLRPFRDNLPENLFRICDSWKYRAKVPFTENRVTIDAHDECLWAYVMACGQKRSITTNSEHHVPWGGFKGCLSP